MQLERRPRPKFATWRYERGLSLAATAAALERVGRELGFADFTCSDEIVRLVCKPFDDRRRRVPGPRLLKAIICLTAGDVREGDFHPAAGQRAA